MWYISFRDSRKLGILHGMYTRPPRKDENTHDNPT